MKKILTFIFVSISLIATSQPLNKAINNKLDTLTKRDTIMVDFYMKFPPTESTVKFNQFNSPLNANIAFRLFDFKLIIPKNYFYYNDRKKVYKIYF